MRILKATFLFFALTAILVAAVQAGTPDLLNYQGRLEGSSGDPVADSTYELSFAVFDVLTGGVALWSETQTSVAVDDGFFSVLLGSTAPLDQSVFAGEVRYLEITINGQPLSPRTRLASVGFAHRIGTVDGATGGVLTDSLMIVPAGAAGAGPPDANAFDRYMIFGFAEGGSMAIYEPIDSKGNTLAEPIKKVEIRGGGLTMFGDTEDDTTLSVLPNGDIVGVGQITMGENSSAGEQTTVLGFENTADGDSSAIGGGSANTTTGTSSVIAGGYNNLVSGEGGTVSGGGTNNVDGAYGVVPGGQFNEADGDYSFAAGYRAKSLHHGSFVWADFTEEDFTTTGEDQFIIRASGGVGIGTTTPTGLLDVVGPSGDGSVNLPDSAIASPEILDEPGLASARFADEVLLTQYKANTEGIVTAAITIPTSGYILLRGGTTLKTEGSSGPNRAYLQITESPGGTLDLPYAALAGGGHYDGPNKTSYESMSVERIYFMAAGTYSFVLEGLAHPDNDLDAITAMSNSYLTASYFPTSYGTVEAIVTNDDATSFDQARSVSTGGYYQVDLRELELKATQAREEAERLEKLLSDARQAQR